MAGPVTYAEFAKGDRGIVRLTRATFSDHENVDLRYYFTPRDKPGKWQPTRKGAAVHLSDLPRLRAALEAMEVEAIGEGLITDDDYTAAGLPLHPAITGDDE